MSSEDVDLNALDSNAAEGTMWLFDDALTWLSGFCEVNDLEKLSAAQAVLIAGFAIVKQRERHQDEKRLHAEQAVRDYDWLKRLVHKASPSLSETEIREALGRIVLIAGV